MYLSLRDSANLFEFIKEEDIPAFLYQLSRAYAYSAGGEDGFVSAAFIIEQELERHANGSDLHDVMDTCYIQNLYMDNKEFFLNEYPHAEDDDEMPRELLENCQEYLYENWHEGIYYQYEEEVERGLNALNLSFMPNPERNIADTICNSPVLEVW